MLVPLADQVFAVARPAFGGIAQELGAVAVHQDFAGHHAQVARFAGFEEGVDRFRCTVQ